MGLSDFMEKKIPIGEPFELTKVEKLIYFLENTKDEVKYQFSKQKLLRNIFYGTSLVNSAGFAFSLANESKLGLALTGLGWGASLAGGYIEDIGKEKMGSRIDYIIDKISD